MIEKACCFSGHRLLPKEAIPSLEHLLDQYLCSLCLMEEYHTFYSGGALGFDLLAAEAVLRAKEAFPNVRLVLALPCEDHMAHWPQSEKIRFEAILANADLSVTLSKQYTPDCMFLRNRYLVDHSSLCICYLTRSSGGTRYTVNYCRKSGVQVLNLAREVRKNRPCK